MKIEEFIELVEESVANWAIESSHDEYVTSVKIKEVGKKAIYAFFPTDSTSSTSTGEEDIAVIRLDDGIAVVEVEKSNYVTPWHDVARELAARGLEIEWKW